MHEDIKVKVETAMRSIDVVRPATAPAFFYSRVEYRLEKKPENFWNRMITSAASPAFAIAIIVFVFTFDALFLFNPSSTPSTTSDNSVSAQYVEFYNAEQEFYSYTYADK